VIEFATPGCIPDYLRPLMSWDAEDFERDAISRGYTKAQAKRFALQYPFLLGKFSPKPPKLPKGWKTTPLSVSFKDGGRIAFLAWKGRQHAFFAKNGRRLSPIQPHLAAAVCWGDAHGWVHP